MAKTSKGYTVPASERREYDRMVQRANRRITANMRYIQQEEITSESAKRSLLSDYVDRGSWATEKTVFSRSIKFKSKREYESHKRHLMQWGATDAQRAAYEEKTGQALDDHTVEGLKKGYEKAIIRSLTQAAIDNNIPLENGRLPGNIRQKIKGLTLEQMTHFFYNDDPVGDLEYLPYSEVDFNGVDEAGFVDNVDTIVNSLQQIFPNANERRYRKLVAGGMDSKAALKTIFPKATEHQIRYYGSKRGRIPEEYRPPRKRKPKKKK